MTLGELAERLQIQHHSAVGLVDRLVAETLVSRQASAVDRRQVHIRLTSQGEKVLAALTEIHRVQLGRIGPKLRTLLDQLGPPDAEE